MSKDDDALWFITADVNDGSGEGDRAATHDEVVAAFGVLGWEGDALIEVDDADNGGFIAPLPDALVGALSHGGNVEISVQIDDDRHLTIRVAPIPD